MNRFRRFVLLSLFAALSQGWAQSTTAPDAQPSREQVLKLFDVMETRKTVALVFNAMIQQTQAMTQEMFKKRMPNATPAQQSQLQALMQDVVRKTTELYPVDEMIDDMVPIYQKHFTKSDVDGILAFYSSPAGQKLLQEAPAMTIELMQSAAPKLQQRMEPVTKELEQRIEQIASASSPASKGTPGARKKK